MLQFNPNFDIIYNIVTKAKLNVTCRSYCLLILEEWVMAFGKFVAQIYAFKANNAFNKGNVEQAIALLGKAYKTGYAKTEIVTTYGYILLKYGRLEEAVKIFEEQLSSKNLSYNELHNIKSNYALTFWKKGQLDEAISLFEEITPYYKNTNVYGSLGYFYTLKGDLEKALNFNLEAYDFNNTNGVILDNLGQTYFMMGDLVKADEIFQELMKLNPKFAEAYYDYSIVLERMGNKELSIEKLKKALMCKTNYLSAITTEEIQSRLEQMEKE